MYPINFANYREKYVPTQYTGYQKEEEPKVEEAPVEETFEA